MAEDSGAFKTNPRNQARFRHIVMDRAAWPRCRTPQENGVGGGRRRRIGANAGQAVALSSNHLIRAAPAARARSRSNLCSPRSRWFKGLPPHPGEGGNRVHAPRLPFSVRRDRAVDVGTGVRARCGGPAARGPRGICQQLFTGAWRQSRNSPSRTKRPASESGEPETPCWRCCASNRSRHSSRLRRAFRRPRRQPSHRQSPLRRMSPRKSPR